MAAEMNVADYFILVVIAMSAVVGLWRGLLREVLSLVAWCAALAVAVFFVDAASARVAKFVSLSSVRLMLSFGGLFLLALFVGGVVNMVISELVLRSRLTGFDRLGGMLIGLLRGATMITVLMLLAALTPVPDDPWWQSSLLLQYFAPMAMWVQSLLPPDYAEFFNFSMPGSGEIPLAFPVSGDFSPLNRFSSV